MKLRAQKMEVQSESIRQIESGIRDLLIGVTRVLQMPHLHRIARILEEREKTKVKFQL